MCWRIRCLDVVYDRGCRKSENVEFSQCRAVTIENAQQKRPSKCGDIVDALVPIDKNNDDFQAYKKMKIREIKPDISFWPPIAIAPFSSSLIFAIVVVGIVLSIISCYFRNDEQQQKEAQHVQQQPLKKAKLQMSNNRRTARLARLDYLQFHRFSRQQIAKLVVEYRYWLNIPHERIDCRLGWLQRQFHLRADELRLAIVNEPRLIQFGVVGLVAASVPSPCRRVAPGNCQRAKAEPIWRLSNSGIFGDDRVLAAAVWRSFFLQQLPDMSPMASLARMDDTRLLTDGIERWEVTEKCWHCDGCSGGSARTPCGGDGRKQRHRSASVCLTTPVLSSEPPHGLNHGASSVANNLTKPPKESRLV
ncbi:hypothetical protein niasHT_035977 [Heterodera trifolii]|uniref:Uncharacterized protein n=1 Tax=Heterodera trifolii TaxID=157864 RepID=A0ABD2IGW8_9BILA